MKINFSGKYKMIPKMLIRRCGYGEVHGREISYARRLAGLDFPRFHVYLEELADGFQVNLHLDQKRPSYGSNTAHSGEYDGEIVEREGLRVKQMIDSLKI